MEPRLVLFELALANIAAGLDYLQLIRMKEAAEESITWGEVNAVIERHETMLAQFEAMRQRKN